MSINKAYITGNLTRDPDFRYTTQGKPVCNMTVAVNKRIKRSDGTIEETCQFIPVTAWNNHAKSAAQYLQKGSQVTIEGEIQIKTWKDENENYKTSAFIRADKIIFGGRTRKEPREDILDEKEKQEDEIPF